MIGYRTSLQDLAALIEAHAEGWLERARERTEKFRAQGAYAESGSIWSDVKPVFMRLQGESKCAYCERKLESVELGKVEQDVEHFRPKGSIRKWAPSKALRDQGVAPSTVPSGKGGYHLLAYHPFNYAASCKPCNSVLKSDHFPIAGEYRLQGEFPPDLLVEKPLLIYPVGDFDEDPESLIRFHGVSPQAVANKGYRRQRALTTIEFFKLDDASARKNLLRERAFIIVAIYPQLERLADGAPAKALTAARDVVDAATAPRSPHTNCARSFVALFNRDRAEAGAVHDAALKLVVSIS